MSGGVSVWIANGRDGTWAWTTKPSFEDGNWNSPSEVMTAGPLSSLVPPGECVEFRLSPVGKVAAQPQPVPVSPLALWIADKSFALAIECLLMGKPLTADDMAKLVEQTVVASNAAAARIEGGAEQ